MASGKTLKLARVKADLTMREVASRMRISRQALWALERAERVDPVREQQYRAALTVIVTVTGEGEA